MPSLWPQSIVWVMSFGVAKIDRDSGLGRALAEADAALYRARNGGRNGVVAASDQG